MSPDSPFSSRPVTFRKRKARILDRVADVAGGLDSKITTTTKKKQETNAGGGELDSFGIEREREVDGRKKSEDVRDPFLGTC